MLINLAFAIKITKLKQKMQTSNNNHNVFIKILLLLLFVRQQLLIKFFTLKYFCYRCLFCPENYEEDLPDDNMNYGEESDTVESE